MASSKFSGCVRSVALAAFGAFALAGAAQASLFFQFNGYTADMDKFYLTIETNNTWATVNAPAHTNVYAGLTAPAYSFSGYEIVNVTGTWYEFGDPTAHPIASLWPIGSIIENGPGNHPSMPGCVPSFSCPPDTIAHSPTDNLFDPNQLFDTGGKVSYGGFEFTVDLGGGSTTQYQLYRDPATGKYAGCPGSCGPVVEVALPGTLPLVLAGLPLLAGVSSRRRRSKGLGTSLR